MKVRWLFLIAILAVGDANSEDTIALGRALSHEFLDVDMPCPEDYICMDGWFRWELSIDRTIAGPSIVGRVTAARLQHTNYIRKYERSLRLFVLRPIVDAKLRETVKADYQLVEVSPRNEMFCINGDPANYGIDTNVYTLREQEYEQYCFELPEEGK